MLWRLVHILFSQNGKFQAFHVATERASERLTDSTHEFIMETVGSRQSLIQMYKITFLEITFVAWNALVSS